MSTVRKINDAVQHQPLRDFLAGAVTLNLANKNCGSAQNSLINPSMSTAGDFAIEGKIYTRAASSSVFALEDTTVPIGGGMTFVLCLNSAGSGIGYASDVLTSEQVSTAGAIASVQASNILPDIPATMCPVGLYTVVAGSVSHVSGSSSFSLVDSAGGSHLFTQLMNMNTTS